MNLINKREISCSFRVSFTKELQIDFYHRTNGHIFFLIKHLIIPGRNKSKQRLNTQNKPPEVPQRYTILIATVRVKPLKFSPIRFGKLLVYWERGPLHQPFIKWLTNLSIQMNCLNQGECHFLRYFYFSFDLDLDFFHSKEIWLRPWMDQLSISAATSRLKRCDAIEIRFKLVLGLFLFSLVIKISTFFSVTCYKQ